MKRIITICIAILCMAALSAQVTIPFEVGTPTWEMLVAAKDEDGPLIFQKPNASSDNLVVMAATDWPTYRWNPPSVFLNYGEEKVKIEPWNLRPLKGRQGGWANIEYITNDGDFSGWAVANRLRQVPTFKLTKDDATQANFIIAWEVGNDLYVVAEVASGYGWQEFSVGKYKDGYVICPYSCTLDVDYDSNHNGILNGKVGNCDLSKFTYPDVEYILKHSGEYETGAYVILGFQNNEGEKEVSWIRTKLIGEKGAVDDTAVYDTAEQMPQFPGGERAIMAHIARNMRYPLICQENGIQGKVVVSVIIAKDGSLTVSGTSGETNPNLVKEAIRVVKTLPKFTPGKIGGKPVNVKFNIPVTFRLK